MLLTIENLTVHYHSDDGVVRALNGIGLSLAQGETLGLVGETGAGKTTLAKAIIGLTPTPPCVVEAGEILFQGKDLLKVSDQEIRDIRGRDISMIFQDPMTALNPVMTVGDQITEVISTHNDIATGDAERRACEMMELVGIPSARYGEYPHQFSGGMKQRIVIAIALACNPQLLIADEPTTALDVTIQAQVLDMIDDLKKKLNTSILLITHDLGVVAQNCDNVAIMYAGEIIEYASVRDVFHRHLHPYTAGLLDSIPSLVEDVSRLTPIEGLMPDPTNLCPGCTFSPRCRQVMAICPHEKPPLKDCGDGHLVRCWLVEEGRGV